MTRIDKSNWTKSRDVNKSKREYLIKTGQRPRNSKESNYIDGSTNKSSLSALSRTELRITKLRMLGAEKNLDMDIFNQLLKLYPF